MRKIEVTALYYTAKAGFVIKGNYGNYLLVSKDNAELHFFLYPDLDPATNYGQVYIRVNGIDEYYRELTERNVTIHPNGSLENKPWGQREFSLLDPDGNLLTFGEEVSRE